LEMENMFAGDGNFVSKFQLLSRVLFVWAELLEAACFLVDCDCGDQCD
jgi:hypothetical protein